jgi:hydrogenase maturation protein HypF
MASGTQRLRVFVRGAVQGVGFRPFVYRVALDLKLDGFVLNSPSGVEIQAEGSKRNLERLLDRVARDAPPLARIQGLEWSFLDAIGFDGFEIRESELTGEKTTLALPDVATCVDCLEDIGDPANRRYRYPFTNCTNCGPRYSIIEALPYDRAQTSMKAFKMCPECLGEYEDPANRRFHAQPNACPICGPQVQLYDENGKLVAEREEAIVMACDAIREGKILALKGLGGFHLMVDAEVEEPVKRLRERKHREAKPLAIMAPDLETVETLCHLDLQERLLITSGEAPIVLLRKRSELLAEAVAPGNPYLGVMLPYTPLHHILMEDLGFPVVATSGNLSDEPLCTSNEEAFERLHGIADLFLVHDRPIVRPVDDSVARVMAGKSTLIRRARGYAPMPIPVRGATPGVLSVGAHLKNSVALSQKDQVVVSQHIGDLETVSATERMKATAEDLKNLFEIEPTDVACDLHPDYGSTRYAESLGLPLTKIQHHEAHAYACLADNDLDPPVLVVSWDGTGLGDDGMIWGGEFFELLPEGLVDRVGYLKPFCLPGGDAAVKDPKRCAVGIEQAGYAAELGGFLEGSIGEDYDRFVEMIEKELNSPWTSSAGRLFDGVSYILGTADRCRFEGEAAMALEFAATNSTDRIRYRMGFVRGGELDWSSLVSDLYDDMVGGEETENLARRFHNSLAEGIVTVADEIGHEKVLLTGGCFQNKVLLEETVARLTRDGYQAYWHQRVPPNDGGIALGQLAAYFARTKKL